METKVSVENNELKIEITGIDEIFSFKREVKEAII